MFLSIFILLFIVLIILISWVGMIRDSKRINVKGPFPLPIVGNAHLFIAKPTELMDLVKRNSLKYGNAFRFHLFTKPFVVLNHPKYIEALLTSVHTLYKGGSIKLFVPWLGQGLVTLSGQKWKSHRKMLTPAFHINILQKLLPVFCKYQKLFTEQMQSVADGRSVDIYPLVTLNVLSTVTESLMGISLKEQQEKMPQYVKSVEIIIKIISLRLSMPFLRLDAIFNLLPYKTAHDKAIEYVHEYTRTVIAARREELKRTDARTSEQDSTIGAKNKYAFLDLLLSSEIDGKPIDDNDLRDEVDTFMFGGHDTTATTICNTLYCLSKHRVVQENIFEEQKHIFGDDFYRDPTFVELQQMKYLEMVIKESLRLYPAIALTERLITEDCEVGELKLIKGTLVWIDIMQCQRQPDLFDAPSEFRPERFEKPLKHPFSWLGFGGGPRNCIGQKFAIMHLKVMLAAIVKNFIVLPTDHEPQFSIESITLKSVNGIHIKLYPRKL